MARKKPVKRETSLYLLAEAIHVITLQIAGLSSRDRGHGDPPEHTPSKGMGLARSIEITSAMRRSA